EPEHVARLIEGADLAAAIGQDLGRPHRAADDLVEIFGRLALAINLFVAGKRHAGSHQVDRTAQQPTFAWWPARRRRVDGAGRLGDHRLGEHGGPRERTLTPW